MRLILALLTTLVGLTSVARSQCQVIDSRFHADGTDGRVNVVKQIDFGSGAQLYVGGLFTRIGGTPARNLARWNGTGWESFGQALDGEVTGIVAWDDGSGTKLYVSGWFTKAGALTVNGIARWDGFNWSALGSGVSGALVHTLAVHDDGTGPKLFIGGDFTTIIGVSNCRYVARWSGTAWSALGFGANAPVFGLASYDDGTGQALYVTGNMSAVGTSALNDTPVSFIARWKSGVWSMPGTGVNAFTRGIAVLDDGTGPALYVGGGFSMAGGGPAARVAKWSPSGWSAVGSGLTAPVLCFAIHDAGLGARLYAGGSITGGIVKLESGQWFALSTPGSIEVRSIASWDDGTGSKLWVGGGFDKLGTSNVRNFAKWNGSSWQRVSTGLGVYGVLDDIVAHDDGSGPALYATSDANLLQAGDAAVVGTIRLKNGAWSTVGYGPKGEALESVQSGPLAGLYVVGEQAPDVIMGNGVAKWDGTVWSRVGPFNMSGGGFARSIAYFDDGTGPCLYVAGTFTTIAAINTNCAKWNGTTWTAVPCGFGAIRDFAVCDDGSGPKLYGIIDSPSNCVKLTVTGWQALSSPPPSGSRRLAVYPNGFGVQELYCGGGATFRRWNGATWDDMNVPNAAGLDDMLVHDDGTGSALYLFAGSVIKWTAAGATDLGIPITNAPQSTHVTGSAVFDDGTGPAIYMAGDLKMVDRKFSEHIGAFKPCTTSQAAAFCFGDYTGGCPCAVAPPFSGLGCPNSSSAGALLTLAGTCSISADTATLQGSGMPNGGALYFQGDGTIAGGNGINFGDGKLCVGGAVVRLGVVFNVGGASQYPQGALPPISVQGMIAGPGLAHYQVWYRDSVPAFCGPQTFNLSNGLTLLWGS